jgi:hypothetical protein
LNNKNEDSDEFELDNASSKLFNLGGILEEKAKKMNEKLEKVNKLLE